MANYIVLIPDGRRRLGPILRLGLELRLVGRASSFRGWRDFVHEEMSAREVRAKICLIGVRSIGPFRYLNAQINADLRLLTLPTVIGYLVCYLEERL